MKFIYYMEKVSGIDIYGLISMAIFMGIFLVALIGVFRSDKKKIDKLSQMPLDQQ